MGIIKDIFQKFGPEYIERHSEAMPRLHKKVIKAILHCKTAAYGITMFQCQECHTTHCFPLSCGNRHCPNCQHLKARAWLDRQLSKQLPGPHFMVTFTMPGQIRDFLRANQRAAYGAMFTAAAEAMKKLAADPKHIGGDLPGFFGVLHTWGRTLQYHPHIHFIVPGGALNKEETTWKPAGNSFYLPVKALSVIFRAKFKDLMYRKQLLHHIPAEAWQQDWNVNCQAVGNSEASMKYLAPYVFRVAISDSRVMKVEDRQVFIRYKKHKSNRSRAMKLDVMEFIRRFLQHVLPKGFMKIRYYGFMNSSCTVALDVVRKKIASALAIPTPTVAESQPPSLPTCVHCQGGLLFKAFFPPPPAYTGLSPG